MKKKKQPTINSFKKRKQWSQDPYHRLFGKDKYTYKQNKLYGKLYGNLYS